MHTSSNSTWYLASVGGPRIPGFHIHCSIDPRNVFTFPCSYFESVKTFLLGEGDQGGPSTYPYSSNPRFELFMGGGRNQSPADTGACLNSPPQQYKVRVTMIQAPLSLLRAQS